nr:hypothetical protein [uncultured Lichenicoccus sp.]
MASGGEIQARLLERQGGDLPLRDDSVVTTVGVHALERGEQGRCKRLVVVPDHRAPTVTFGRPKSTSRSGCGANWVRFLAASRSSSAKSTRCEYSAMTVAASDANCMTSIGGFFRATHRAERSAALVAKSVPACTPAFRPHRLPGSLVIAVFEARV